MTVGTPDVVTAISMVKNDEIDKFVALMKKKLSKIIQGSPIRVKHWVKNFMWTVSNSMM